MVRRTLLMLALAALAPFFGLAVAQADPVKPKKTEKKTGKAPVVAVFQLHGDFTESPPQESLFGTGRKLALKDLVTRLKKAGDDPNVKAIVLLSDGEALGNAQTEEVRQVMAKVRKSGKDIYVHADSLAMREYVLLSGATRISVVPTGDVWVTGVYAESPYVRGLLNKLGVQPDFLTCGDYKSAAEIFMRDGPSPAAEAMQNWLLDSLYGTYLRLIAEGRGVDQDKVKQWVDNGPYIAEKAKEIGLVDAVEHRQDFTAMLKEKYGHNVVFEKRYGDKKTPNIDFSSPFGVLKFWGDLLKDGKSEESDKPAIAIVYVEGAISLGGGGPASPFSDFSGGGAHSTDIRKALDEAARDDNIKAVILRVNSPGGSAVASEIILDATRRVKAKKPFVVSMGDVAGSGGYYVACASDVVFADAATITGSIGVVSGKLVTTPMWNKVGITFKPYKRGQNAGVLNTSEGFSSTERKRMQAWMDDIYGVFKKHVTDSRGSRLKKPIDELAGGRVYTGQQALELGLVDKIGTFQDAITYIADQAKLKDYDLRVIPKPKNFLEQILEESSGSKDDHGWIRARSAQSSLVDLALPYLQHLDPKRVAVIKLALQRLQMLDREGVVLMMPEMILP